MGANLDIWAITDGHPAARRELEQYRKITDAAIASVKSATAGEIIESHLALQNALRAAGEM